MDSKKFFRIALGLLMIFALIALTPEQALADDIDIPPPGGGNVDGTNNPDTITIQAGATVVDVTAGRSDDTIINNGTANTLQGELGNDTITNNGSSSSITGGIGQDTITNNGDALLIAGELGNDTITNNGTALLVAGGIGDDTIANTGGALLVAGGTGDDTIANSGDALLVVGGDDNDTITNSGNTILIAGMEGDDTIHNNGVALLGIAGGDGNDTITHSGETLFIAGGDGDDTVTLRGDESVIVAGQIFGGAGTDTLNFQMQTNNRRQYEEARSAVDRSGGDGQLQWGGRILKWSAFEVLLNNIKFFHIVDNQWLGGQDGVAQIMARVKDGGIEYIRFFGEQNGELVLITKIEVSTWENAAAGAVLVSMDHAATGLHLTVTVLDDGRLQVVFTSLADGSVRYQTII